MKYLILFLLLPFLAPGQTVHIEKEKVLYKGKVKVPGLDKKELTARARAALLLHVKGSNEKSLTEDREKGMIATEGKIRLTTPYYTIRSVHYLIEIEAKDDGYEYKIDSVSLKERERGGKATVTPSEELVKNMEVTGPVATRTEKILNEIDMNFQKLLALIEADMKKPSGP